MAVFRQWLSLVLGLTSVVASLDWEEWLKLALGLWLIAAHWILGFAHTSATSQRGVGLVVTYLALLELGIIYNPEDFAWRRTGHRGTFAKAHETVAPLR